MTLKKSIARITSISGRRSLTMGTAQTVEEYQKERERLVPRPVVAGRFS